MNKRTRKLDIPPKVKKEVFLRDEGKCVICGNDYNVMPNSHFIKRSQGGLGIKENVFTACTNFTNNKCHERWEHHKCSEQEKDKVIAHFKALYPDWNEQDLYYTK